ncbi:Rv1733c family protein [Streptomyces nodosus]|uniref:Rv1733c family protein n=1 Tax=Streptomyces nodosus TaxID=40318 RepID=UPI0036E432B8
MASEIPPAQPPPEEPRRVLLWRWRRSPLRRSGDLVRAWLGLGLLLTLLGAVPTAVLLAGKAAHRHLHQTAEQAALSGHHTDAVLLHDALRHPEPGSAEANATRYPAKVRFMDPGGRTRTGQAHVEPGISSGSTVRVWVDAHGEITDPPLTGEQIRTHALGWATLAGMAVTLFGALFYGVCRRRLERRNLRAWDAEWAETAPRWTAST